MSVKCDSARCKEDAVTILWLRGTDGTKHPTAACAGCCERMQLDHGHAERMTAGAQASTEYLYTILAARFGTKRQVRRHTRKYRKLVERWEGA